MALDEARAALTHGDVPIGAVVLVDGQVVARRHNERELTHDPTAHAEILALRDAAAGPWVVAPRRRHPGGHPRAVRHVRRRRGQRPGRPGGVRCPRPQGRRALGSLYHLGSDPRLNHEFEVRRRRGRRRVRRPADRVLRRTPRPVDAARTEPASLGVGRAATNVVGRKVARADEWDGLESRCGLRLTKGSNPLPSARASEAVPVESGTVRATPIDRHREGAIGSLVVVESGTLQESTAVMRVKIDGFSESIFSASCSWPARDSDVEACGFR